MPNINISLNDEEFKILQNLKKENNKTWKDLLLSNIEKDIILEEINNCYKKLKLLVPNLQESLEYMRAVTIRFYKLPDTDQKMKAKEINNIVIDSFNEIINMIKEVENEH